MEKKVKAKDFFPILVPIAFFILVFLVFPAVQSPVRSNSTQCTWQQLSFSKFPVTINSTNITTRNVEFLLASNFVKQGNISYVYDINVTNAVQIDMNEYLLYGNAIVCV